MESDELLCRFLLRHLAHAVKVYPDRTEEYAEIIRTADRFMEEDIDEFVKQTENRRKSLSQDLNMDRELGKLQLNILKKMLEDDIREISDTPSDDSAKAQFLLGKEEGMKQALRTLKDLMEKTNTVYR